MAENDCEQLKLHRIKSILMKERKKVVFVNSSEKNVALLANKPANSVKSKIESDFTRNV